MQCVTREAFEHELMLFVTSSLLPRRRRTADVSTSLDRSTRLFETGVVDSLGIFDLIAFVEHATGSQVPLRKVDLNHFGTIERIARSFWHDKESL